LLVFVASCLLYLINLERAPHPDELYHMLAASGLLEHGEPRIAEGLYTRVFAYTWLVSRMFLLMGESLTAARLPSVIAMAALNTLVFVWLRRETGTRAAALAAGLLAISPFALDIAQFARFYAFQTLSFFAGCLAAFELARRPWPITARSIAYGGAAVLCLAFAAYMQPTTLLGVAGLGLWLGTVVCIPWLADRARPRRQKTLAVALVLAATAILLGLMLATGALGEFWHRYR
jgi:uncharacterized membrane protein